VLLGGKKDPISVAGYTPINEDSLEFFPEFEQYLEFASDIGDGLYFIDPTLADPKVLFLKWTLMTLRLADVRFPNS
jgi:hypothetical protein